MKRLYFLVPNIDSATAIVDELRHADVPDDHLFVAGNDHERLEQAHLHEAGVLHGTGLLTGLTTGLALGSTTGLIAGIAAVAFPPAGLILGSGAVVGMGVLGAGFGGWLGSMLGIAATDPGVLHFEEEIKKGAVLILVDAPREREYEISERVRRLHPEARIESVPHRSLRFGATAAAPPTTQRDNDFWDSRHL